MTDTVLARIAALKTMAAPELKQKWRELFDTEPPPYNRRFLESRLAYRVQELAYGGLKLETVERLVALGEQLDGGNIAVRKAKANSRPIAGTQLIRDWKGVEHRVTVRQDQPARVAVASSYWVVNEVVIHRPKLQAGGSGARPVRAVRRCSTSFGVGPATTQ